VPIAAVNKYHDALHTENKVRFSEQVSTAKAPSANSRTHESEPQGTFRSLVSARSNRGHVAGSLFRSEQIHRVNQLGLCLAIIITPTIRVVLSTAQKLRGCHLKWS